MRSIILFASLLAFVEASYVKSDSELKRNTVTMTVHTAHTVTEKEQCICPSSYPVHYPSSPAAGSSGPTPTPTCTGFFLGAWHSYKAHHKAPTGYIGFSGSDALLVSEPDAARFSLSDGRLMTDSYYVGSPKDGLAVLQRTSHAPKEAEWVRAANGAVEWKDRSFSHGGGKAAFCSTKDGTIFTQYSRKAGHECKEIIVRAVDKCPSPTAGSSNPSSVAGYPAGESSRSSTRPGYITTGAPGSPDSDYPNGSAPESPSGFSYPTGGYHGSPGSSYPTKGASGSQGSSYPTGGVPDSGNSGHHTKGLPGSPGSGYPTKGAPGLQGSSYPTGRASGSPTKTATKTHPAETHTYPTTMHPTKSKPTKPITSAPPACSDDASAGCTDEYPTATPYPEEAKLVRRRPVDRAELAGARRRGLFAAPANYARGAREDV